MPFEIICLFAFEGPNVVGPQSAILLRVRSPRDASRRLAVVLKEAAQQAGLVIGYLDVVAVQEGEGWIITASFTTPLPAIGREVAAFAVDEARARENGDEDWDRDTPIYNLRRQRRKVARPLPLLQLEAEALKHGLPILHRPDGLLQIGTGARGWAFDPTTITSKQPATPPWERLGLTPIIAFAGGAARQTAIDLVGAAFRYAAPHVRAVADLDRLSAAAILSEPQLDQLFAGVTVETIAAEGLPFDRCFVSAILDLEGTPTSGLTDEEWAQALGVPMLVTDPEEGFAIVNADDPRVAALGEYAPCKVIFVSTGTGGAVVAAHRAAGGAALVVRDGEVIMAAGDDEQRLGSAPPVTGAALLGALAAGVYLLGLRGHGIDVALPWDDTSLLFHRS